MNWDLMACDEIDIWSTLLEDAKVKRFNGANFISHKNLTQNIV